VKVNAMTIVAATDDAGQVIQFLVLAVIALGVLAVAMLPWHFCIKAAVRTALREHHCWLERREELSPEDVVPAVPPPGYVQDPRRPLAPPIKLLPKRTDRPK
jgi:hypothetical protein